MKCGLEIHQRLRGEKLFCRSPCPEADEAVPAGPCSFIRKILSVSSELGVQDAAAAFEQSRERKIKYLADKRYVSLMEEDEEPPVAINHDALAEALRIAATFGSTIVDEVHVMRKSVADGSNTSGFQRTAVIAFGGSVHTPLGSVGLQAICLEEESATPAGEEEDFSLYNISRLGVPLIEIATEPTIKSGAHAKETAEKIGLALRMSPMVMRGIGTIRQDVNISTEKGERIEIKGMQDLSLFSNLVDNEVRRQDGLVAIANELHPRFKGSAVVEEKWLDAGGIFSKTQCGIISKALSSGGVALAARLPKFAGFLGKQLYENRRFGTELSDYAKMAGGVRGLIHSDEDMGKYKISEEELDELRAALSVREGDAFIIIADAKRKAEKAMSAALQRANFQAVPKETRRADTQGGSSFMRPLPGAARMYPETDIAPLRITPALLAKIKSKPVESLDEKRGKLFAALGPELGEQMLRSRNLALFESLCEGGADPKLAAVTLEQTSTTLRREGVAVDKISEKRLAELFHLYSENRITKAAIPEILKISAKSPDEKIAAIIASNSLLRISGKALSDLWTKEGGDMKSFMAKYRLVADGSDIAQLAKKGKAK